MTKKKQEKKQKSMQAGISPAAHKKMREEGYAATPRRNIREQVNVLNNLPANL